MCRQEAAIHSYTFATRRRPHGAAARIFGNNFMTHP
jgi:hypothetical protein